MLKLKPPTHAIDGLAVFIAQSDPAWDLPHIVAERNAFIAAALAEKQARTENHHAELERQETIAAIARAPVERYYAGKTRYQLDAPDTAADGSPTTAQAYLQPGQRPTRFGLQRLNRIDFQTVQELEHPRARLLKACELGLRSIESEDFRWPTQSVTLQAALDAIHALNPALLPEIGEAVILLSRPLDPEAEVPR